MSNTTDFVIENGILKRYIGSDCDILVPDGVTNIGESAFESCHGINSVKIPDSVTSIGNSAFKWCPNLTSVNISDSVTSIGNNAFAWCHRLVDVNIPDSVISIGDGAFSDCKSLTNVCIPDSVISIGDGAFSDCKSLTNISIPDSVINIGKRVFANCLSLPSKDGFIIMKGQLIYCEVDSDEIIIPDGVVEFGDYDPFYGKEKIKTIRIPKSIRKIEDCPFYGFSSLEVMYIPLESIGENMFGSSGKTIELVLTEENKEEKHVIAAFRKDYYTQVFNIKKECLLPFGDDLPDYDKLVACGKHEGFQMNEDGRLKAMFYRLADKEHPVTKENADMFAEFLSAKLTKAVKYAEAKEEPSYIAILRDIGAIPEDKKKRIKKQLSGSSVDSIRQMAEQLDDVSTLPFAAESEKEKEILPDIDMKYIARLKELQAKALLMRNGVDTFPEVLLANGTEKAAEEYLLLILAEYVSQGKDVYQYRISQIADEVAALLDKRSLSEALYKIYLNSSRKMVLVPPIMRFCDSEIAVKVYNEYKKNRWSEDFAKKVILLSDEREAMFIADKIGYLDWYASMRGMDQEQMRDTIIYDFGFDANGEKMIDLGTKKVTVMVDHDLNLSIKDPSTGKISKSIPKRDADPACYETAKAEFADLKKNVKKAVKTKCSTLFPDFLSGETVSAEKWAAAYLKNPLLRIVASLLVWKQGRKTFTVFGDQAIDVKGNVYTITDKKISLAHPMEMKAEDVTAWQKYFVEKGLKQPFEQIWEPVVDASEIKKDRYAGCMIPYYRFVGQAKRGITVADYDFHNEICIDIEGCQTEIERIDWRRHDIEMNDRFEIKEFSFKKYTRQINHVVAYLDRVTVYDRILKDDATVAQFLPAFTLAQITEFIKLAADNGCSNVMALLLEYKNNTFADYDPMEEFSLDL